MNRLHRPAYNLCVFCGSNPGSRPEYADAARALGRALATSGTGLVYGGGSVGLMGIVADACLEAGGHVEGVLPEGLVANEVGHYGLHRLHRVESMHARKALMAQLSDGFIALPGGFGTLEELFEVVTWAQIGIHNKPVGLLNVAGYYDGLLAFIDHAVREGFIPEAHRRQVISEAGVEPLLTALSQFTAPPPQKKWLELEET